MSRYDKWLNLLKNYKPPKREYYKEVLGTYIDHFGASGEVLDTISDNMPDEDLRIRIFQKALEQGKGLECVEKQLREKKLRRLYTRNPMEFVLKFALQYNDFCEKAAPEATKYDRSSFQKLYEEATKGKLKAAKESEVERQMTLGELHRFVMENSDFEEGAGIRAMTRNVTVKFDLVGSDGWDFSEKSKAEKALKKEFAKLSDDVSNSAQIQRYYIAKYSYWLIVSQLLQLKDILLMCAKNTPVAVFDLVSKEKDIQKPFTLKYYFFEAVEMRRPSKELEEKKGQDKAEEIAKKQKAQDLPELEPKMPRKSDPDRSGRIEEALAEILVLDGVVNSLKKTIYERTKPLKEDTKNGKKKKNKNENKNDKTSSIFKVDEATLKKIENLTVEDFFNLRISYRALYSVLFKELSGNSIRAMSTGDGEVWQDDEEPEVIVETKEAIRDAIVDITGGEEKAFLTDFFEGRIDLSRTALVLGLASIKAHLQLSEATLKKIDLYNEDSKLTLTRVNHILIRCGYVALGDLKELPDGKTDLDKLDRIYARLFSVDGAEEAGEVLGEFADAVDDFKLAYRFSPLAYNRPSAKSKALHQQIKEPKVKEEYKVEVEEKTEEKVRKR